jgi:dGTPase
MVASTGADESRRQERRSAKPSSNDQRSGFEVDHDRLLYSHALRRLAGVTQTVSAAEGWGFHNRLTHSLKVSQVARRIAEFLQKKGPYSTRRCVAQHIDPDVVAAAALAHDIGHPPFGHVAEEALNRLVKAGGDDDGFEGNAQSFRIVATLERRHDGPWGLDLSRATLAAILKYPWSSQTVPASAKRPSGKYKYGAYEKTEGRILQWVQEHDSKPLTTSLEAQIMDLADDITFSVHDLEDFVMQGIVPLRALQSPKDGEFDTFIASAEDRWLKEGRTWDGKQYENVSFDLMNELAGAVCASGTVADRFAFRERLSQMIAEFIQSVELVEDGGSPCGYKLSLPDRLLDKIEILKQLTWSYVIEGPALAAQQNGHRQTVETLFAYYLDLLNRDQDRLLPPMYRRDPHIHDGTATCARRAADIVCDLTDEQAASLFSRLTGVHSGTVRTNL